MGVWIEVDCPEELCEGIFFYCLGEGWKQKVNTAKEVGEDVECPQVWKNRPCGGSLV
jgi:hypothetical protein